MNEVYRRRLLAALGAGGGAALAGCLDDAPTGGDWTSAGSVTAPDSRPAGVADDHSAYAEGVAAFGTDLLRQVVAADPDANLLISPLSISVTLGMTWAGTRGETAEEIRETLHYPHEQEQLHPTVGALQYDLHDAATEGVDGDFHLSLVNALWVQEGFDLAESFLDTVETNYGAPAETLDFAQAADESRERVNDWVREQTDGNIEELLPEGSLNRRTVLVLTNAVSLLADWNRPFDPEDTDDHEFTALDGSTSTVPMMSLTDDFRYLRDGEEEYALVELPYANESVSMVVVVPESFESFESTVDGTWLTDRFAELDEESEGEVRVMLPRFEFESALPLGDHLVDLGMPSAFESETANFGGLVPDAEDTDTLVLSEVYHDTYVAVDEEGTEAAAATGSEIQEVSAPPTVAADRPFLFLIRERNTNAVLFLGRVVSADDMG